MAWLKDIAWIKIGISAAVALVGFFLVNGLSYLMITRSRRCPTGERVKSIQAFNASVILYLAIDFLLLSNVMLAQDIGSTVKPRAAFFAIFLASTCLSMMISRANVPIAPRLVSWIWLLLSASTAAILLNKGWFGAPDPRLSAWTSAGLHRQAYNFILAYAVNEHSFALGTQPRGVRLLPHAGSNQFAITYLLEGLWLRKYSILLKNPRTEEMAEFVFTFGSSLPDFAQFCRDAYWFDRVVTSLEWE